MYHHISTKPKPQREFLKLSVKSCCNSETNPQLVLWVNLHATSQSYVLLSQFSSLISRNILKDFGLVHTYVGIFFSCAVWPFVHTPTDFEVTKNGPFVKLPGWRLELNEFCLTVCMYQEKHVVFFTCTFFCLHLLCDVCLCDFIS